MKNLFVKFAAYVGFLVCLTMQAYLGLVLTTTNVWAQVDVAEEPVKKEFVDQKPSSAAKSTKVDQEQAKTAEKLEKAAKKLGLPFKDIKFGKDSFKVTVDEGNGKEEQLDINLAGLIEQPQKPKREHSVLENITETVVPVTFFIFLFLVFKLAHDSRLKMKKEQMETVKLLVEKGQPIPPGIFFTDEKGTWLGLMQRGLKFTAIGLGLALFFYTVDGPWALGAIPFFIGLGQIISAKIRQKYEHK